MCSNLKQLYEVIISFIKNRYKLLLLFISIIVVVVIISIGANIKASNKIVSEGYTISEDMKGLVGEYESFGWKGKRAKLVLNDNGTCIYPESKEGYWLWKLEASTITIYADDAAIEKYSEDGKKDLSSKSASIVGNGLIVEGVFFNRVE